LIAVLAGLPVEHAILGALRATDPDALTPRAALELLYQLRKQLDK